MQLVEREAQAARLAALLAAAGGGAGRCALLLGEAGIGKTALLRAFCAALPAPAALLWSACEPLFTPRPLGPLVDLAEQLPPGLAHRIHAGHDRGRLFADLLAHLAGRGRPAVLVIEDAHWADESTVEWIAYAARRLGTLPLLLLLSARDDEPDADRLALRLGATVERIALPPLSAAAVERLAAASGRDGALLARQTGGNPFYLTELLAAGGEALPGSVRDAVLARIARLPADARRVVECAAVAPGRLELAALAACVPEAAAALPAALAAGVLQQDRHGLAFRHEIARRAVEDALPPGRCQALHAALLGWLQAGGGRRQLARQVHHARAAGLAQAVARLAPRAAARAARLGAHREAAALYRLALAAAVPRAAAAQAALREAAADELQLTGALAEAIALREQALALRRAQGDARGIGVNLLRLGLLHRQANVDAARYLDCAQQAVAALAPLGDGAELAQAYAAVAHAYTLQSAFDTAIDWGERAVGLAERCADPRALALALHRLGSARVCRARDAAGRAQIERALALAIAQRADALAADIFVGLQTQALLHHDHADALAIGARGAAFCRARDLDAYLASLRARSAYSLLHLGRWAEAEAEYRALADAPGTPAPSRNSAHYALQRLAARRDDSADDYWRQLQLQVCAVALEYRPAAIAAACAEAAWLRGDCADAIAVARLGLGEAQRSGDGRLAGPLLVWLRRLGAPAAPCAGTLLPACALELAGDVAAAAQAWQALGNPYEQALALLAGDAAQARAALALLEQLGAQRAARVARSRLQAPAPRRTGPAAAPAAGGPAGLTPREREVHALLLEGLSNEAIAQRLDRSPRTVEQHVSAVLAKSGVRTRHALLARAGAAAAGT